jgi:hypothetical protein
MSLCFCIETPKKNKDERSLLEEKDNVDHQFLKEKRIKLLKENCIKHKLTKDDTLVSLAVKYSVQISDIKEINNLKIDDLDINNFEEILIPKDILLPDIVNYFINK